MFSCVFSIECLDLCWPHPTGQKVVVVVGKLLRHCTLDLNGRENMAGAQVLGWKPGRVTPALGSEKGGRLVYHVIESIL